MDKLSPYARWRTLWKHTLTHAPPVPNQRPNPPNPCPPIRSPNLPLRPLLTDLQPWTLCPHVKKSCDYSHTVKSSWERKRSTEVMFYLHSFSPKLLLCLEKPLEQLITGSHGWCRNGEQIYRGTVASGLSLNKHLATHMMHCLVLT